MDIDAFGQVLKSNGIRSGSGVPCSYFTPLVNYMYADNELDYCPRCQTDGRLLADRGLSRLLGQDFPKRIEELEERQAETKRRS